MHINTHKSHKISLFIFLLLLIQNYSKAENILFDLGGVLLEVNKNDVLKKMGFCNICLFILINRKFPNKLFFYKTLREIEPFSNTTAKDPDGDILPYSICSWLKSLSSNKELIEQLSNSVEEFNKKGYFKNNLEKNIFLKFIDTTFNPKTLAAVSHPIKEGIALLKDCHKQQRHKLYIISNWDKESFEIIFKKYPEIFDLFDGIVISGIAQEIKPNKGIYEYLLNTYNLQPKECIFIDDQEENIFTAETLGIKGILCKNFADVRKTLQSYGVL